MHSDTGTLDTYSHGHNRKAGTRYLGLIYTNMSTLYKSISIVVASFSPYASQASLVLINEETDLSYIMSCDEACDLVSSPVDGSSLASKYICRAFVELR
jgi:hypothetical protein